MVEERSKIDDDRLDALLRSGRPAVLDGALGCATDPPFDQVMLIRYQEGAIAEDAERSRVEAHLLACSRCRDFLVEHARLAAGHRLIRIRRVIATATAAAAAAVVLLAMIFRGGPPNVRPEYQIRLVRGIDQTMRGTSSSAAAPLGERWTVHPYSHLIVQLEPVPKDGPRTPHVELRIFVAGDDGRLAALDDSIWTKSVDHDYAVFELRASGRQLFGTGEGERSLIFAFALSAGLLERAAGKKLEEAVAEEQVQWIVQPFLYLDRDD